MALPKTPRLVYAGFLKAPLLTKEGWMPLRQTGWFSADGAVVQKSSPPARGGVASASDDEVVGAGDEVVRPVKKLPALFRRGGGVADGAVVLQKLFFLKLLIPASLLPASGFWLQASCF